MRLFSTSASRKPPATARPEAKASAEVVSITTRRIEITVEREWRQAVLPAQENAVPVAPAANINDADVSPGRISGKLD